MLKKAIFIFSLTETILCASIFTCPEGTRCPEKGSIESNSFDFLDKLGPKQYQSIIKLKVTNASLEKLPAEVKYLKKLEYLDLSDNNIQVSSIPSLSNLKTLKLSRNNIKGISLILLPNNIEDLDLSSNLLSHIPKDWSSLKALKNLRLQKNPIDCDCYSNNIKSYKRLIEKGVYIPESILCNSPKQYAGKNIDSINCTAEDEMINDQGFEGSGADQDVFSEDAISKAPYLQESNEVEENEVIDDKDELPREEEHYVNAEAVSTTEVPAEGSGDLEGSGFVPIEIEHVPACLFDCATPEPVGSRDNKNDTGAVPGPTDQFKIIAEDVFQPIFDDEFTSTSTSEAPTTVTTTISTTPLVEDMKEVEEEVIVNKETVGVKSSYPKDIEWYTNETRTAEMEKATALNHNNYAVYVVVICGLLLAVIFLVFLIKKRKAKRLNKNRCDLPAKYGEGEEMKPLEKPSIQPVNEKNGKNPHNIPEHIPLINGNGKLKDDPILKSYTPLEHPESQENEEPVIREKSLELLTPLTERVTIRASEIPESIPKTPVLVHRQKNSEGEIVTTVVPP